MDFANTKAKAITIDGSKLSTVSLATSKIKHFGLIDVVADDCLFYGGDFDGSSWLRVEITGSVLSGMVITEANLNKVLFKNCKLDLANFRFSKLTNVHFVGCKLNEADFYQAKLKNVLFECCDLTSAVFDSASLDSVNLQSSNLTDIKGVLSLKVATIDAVQLVTLAPLLAAEVGLQIETSEAG